MAKRKVLIVDDEMEMLRSVKMGLESMGPYDVHIQNKPELAVRTVEEVRPDIILLDVIMPGMDGGMVAAQIREDERITKTPIVFLTSILGKTEAAVHQGIIGNEEVLAKPTTVEEIIAVIERVLSK